MDDARHPPGSFRDDPAIPAFDEARPLAVIDGTCALCSFSARMIGRFDRREEFQIATAQGPLGSALLRHYGMDPADPDSWLLIVDGQARTGADGMIAAGARMGGPGWLLQILRLFPHGAREWLYQRVARNRYTLFGRADICAVPDPRLRARLID